MFTELSFRSSHHPCLDLPDHIMFSWIDHGGAQTVVNDRLIMLWCLLKESGKGTTAELAKYCGLLYQCWNDKPSGTWRQLLTRKSILRMVVPSISVVFCFAVLTSRFMLVLFMLHASVFAVSANTAFRKMCFPFRGPRQESIPSTNNTISNTIDSNNDRAKIDNTNIKHCMYICIHVSMRFAQGVREKLHAAFLDNQMAISILCICSICICICMYIYIYIERERCICICMCV